MDPISVGLSLIQLLTGAATQVTAAIKAKDQAAEATALAALDQAIAQVGPLAASFVQQIAQNKAEALAALHAKFTGTEEEPTKP